MATAWNQSLSGSPGSILLRKIWAVRLALRKWNKDHFGNIHKAIKSAQEQILVCQQGDPSEENLHRGRFTDVGIG